MDGSAVGSTQDLRAGADLGAAEDTGTAPGRGTRWQVLDLPLEAIDPEDLGRDRLTLDEGEMQELTRAILQHGLRMPVEVYELSRPDGVQRYGLLSGYRRLHAMHRLSEMFEGTKFTTIRALVNEPGSVSAAYVAMVEENQVRAGISLYEQGRIAVVAAERGVFASVEAAVDALFGTAPRAKRSKLRRFALIHAELGDLLRFPRALTERKGLRLAAALVRGAEDRICDALDRPGIASAEQEWALLEPLICDAEREQTSRRGAPGGRRAALRDLPDRLHLANGVTLRCLSDRAGYLFRLDGPVTRDMVEAVLDAAQARLGQLR